MERLSFEDFFSHPFLDGADSPRLSPLLPPVAAAPPELRVPPAAADSAPPETPIWDTAAQLPLHAASPAPPVVLPPPAPPAAVLAQPPSPLRLPAAVGPAVTAPSAGARPVQVQPGATMDEPQASPPRPIPTPEEAPFATFNQELHTPRNLRSPTAALLASSPPHGAQMSPLLPSCIPELTLPMSPMSGASFGAQMINLAPAATAQPAGQLVAVASASAGQLVATRRQVVPVTVAGSLHPPNALPAACMVAGLANPTAPHGLPSLAVYDKSLDGLDNEYVLVSQGSNARAAALSEQRSRRGAPEKHEWTADPGGRGMLQLQQTALSGGPLPMKNAAQGEERRQAGCPPQSPGPHVQSVREHHAPQPVQSLQQRRHHRQQLLAGRAFAVAELAQQSADGGLAPHGESFSMVESLALHVKALDLTQQALHLAQADKQADAIVLVNAIHPTNTHADVLRARFATLLESAEWIREQLRCEQSLRSTPTVCVEELLYRHALAMGREAAVDEMVGKLHTSRALYQRAKLLLEQLAEEPQVGHADRAVLSKYAAGFAWRLQEIAMKGEADEARGSRGAC